MANTETINVRATSSGVALMGRQFKANEKQLRRLGTTGARTGGILARSATKAGAGFGKLKAAILSVGIAATGKKILDFDSSLGQLQANAKFTNKQMFALRARWLALSAATGTSKEAILGAANVLQDYGGILKKNLSIMPDLVRVSRAFGAATKDTAKVFAVLNLNLGLTPKGAIQGLTKLAAQANAATIKFSDLARVAPAVFSLAAGRGFTGQRAVDQIGSLLQGLGKGTGGNADRAKTQFDAILRALTDKTNLKLLQKKGINPFKDDKGNLKDIDKLLASIFQKFKGAQQLGKIFKDSESNAGILTLAKQTDATGKFAKGSAFRNAQIAGRTAKKSDVSAAIKVKETGVARESEQFKKLLARFDQWLQTFGRKLIAFVSADPKKAALIAGGSFVALKVAKGLLGRLFRGASGGGGAGSGFNGAVGVQRVFVVNMTGGAGGGAAGKVGAALGVVGVGAAAFMLARAADKWLNISGKLATDAAALQNIAQKEKQRQNAVGVSAQVRGAGVNANAQALLSLAKRGGKSFEDAQRPGSRRALTGQNAAQSLIEQAQGGIGPQQLATLIGTLGKLGTVLANQKIVVTGAALDGAKAKMQRGGSAI